jgi:galactokinase
MVAEPLAPRLTRAVAAFSARFGESPGWLGWAPGRINLIGEHTDYNAGLAMPAAIDRWVVVALSLPGGAGLRVRAEDYDADLELPAGSLPSPAQPSWVRFALGCIAEFGALHPLAGGLRAVVAGDVPLGAGLSSSAAVELAWLNALRAATGAPLADLDLCRMGQRVEHRHLGLCSGLLDQLASQCARAGHALRIDFADLAVRAVPLDLVGWTWAVLDTGVRRELAASAYRERVAECARGLAQARALDPAIRGFRDLTEAHLAALPEALASRRLGHVLAENARVCAMEGALAAGDGERAGALLSASHRSLRDAYAVSCPELDLLVGLAEAAPGCAGARMVGGGFGGCVLALVREEAWADFAGRVVPAYQARTGRESRALRFGLVQGAGSRRLRA